MKYASRSSLLVLALAVVPLLAFAMPAIADATPITASAVQPSVPAHVPKFDLPTPHVDVISPIGRGVTPGNLSFTYTIWPGRSAYNRATGIATAILGRVFDATVPLTGHTRRMRTDGARYLFACHQWTYKLVDYFQLDSNGKPIVVLTQPQPGSPIGVWTKLRPSSLAAEEAAKICIHGGAYRHGLTI